MTGKRIADWGDEKSKIIIIGSYPGRWEEARGEPFSGPAGLLLNAWLENVGLSRAVCYMTYAYPFKPTVNFKCIERKQIDYWVNDLHACLARLIDPYVLVPLCDTYPGGDLSLFALTGKKNIMDWRGSPLIYTDTGGREIKCIPSLHPGMTFKAPRYENRCRGDWLKIKIASETRQNVIIERKCHIRPSLEQLRQWKDQLLSSSQPIAVDIETHPVQGITCVGFAPSPHEGYVIPLGVQHRILLENKRSKAVVGAENTQWQKRLQSVLAEPDGLLTDTYANEVNMLARTRKALAGCYAKWRESKTGKITPAMRKHIGAWEDWKGIKPPEPGRNFITVGYWKTKEDEERALQTIRDICASENPKILQNGLYDQYWLAERDVYLNNYVYDTLEMHHCFEANEEHSLHYLASVFANEPYWKKEAKFAEESARSFSNQEALWRYNVKDTTVTYELYEIFLEKLKTSERLPFYFRHYTDLRPVLFDMMRRGLNVDQDELRKKYDTFRAKHDSLVIEIESIVGYSLAGRKTLSSTKIKKYLYEDLKLPKQIKRRGFGKTETADEVAIRHLILQYPHKLKEVGGCIINARRAGKLMAFCDETKLDADGRFRSSYKFTTTTGRLASSANPRGTGANAQNQDRELRDIYRAEPGMFILCVDLSQVESRIVYMLTRDPDLVREAQSMPWEHDMHTENARAIFKIPQNEPVTKAQRYLGKKAVHGGQRGMRGKMLSDQLLKEGKIITAEECDGMIDAYFEAKSAIRDVYFAETRMQVRQHRCLVNSWGRRIDWPYARFDDSLYQEAYSWLPQSEAADHMNQRGLAEFYAILGKYRMRTTINAQVHDELVLNTTLEEGYWVAHKLQELLSHPMTFFGAELRVPVSVKIGRTWACEHEWDKFPSEKIFNEAARSLFTKRYERPEEK